MRKPRLCASPKRLAIRELFCVILCQLLIGGFNLSRQLRLDDQLVLLLSFIIVPDQERSHAAGSIDKLLRFLTADPELLRSGYHFPEMNRKIRHWSLIRRVGYHTDCVGEPCGG